mgnify:CR=1 FL=1
MRRFGRRTISIIMSVITVLSCFAGLTFSVWAQTSGDYEYEVLDDGTVSITKHNGFDEEVAIPSEIDGKRVTKIGEFAFKDINNNYLTSVEIPECITEIDCGAFRDCYNLVNVNIPNSIKSIGDMAFRDCRSLQHVIIPEGVLVLGEESFKGCTGFTSVTIPRSVTEIGDEAFGYFYYDGDKLIDGYTIYGYSGTAAEEYARENGFMFAQADNSAEVKQTMSVGDTVTFGSYPQTDVTSELGSQLTAAAPSTDEWTSYDYYYDGEKSDYMKYYDLSYNGSRYRGVYFTKYRPYCWNTTESVYQSFNPYMSYFDKDYKTNKVYWFRYDPLTWRILDPSTGYVICENIIDSQAFNDERYEHGKAYNDETYTHYANNWEYSTIRSWLNETFFFTAFSSNEKNQILCTKLTTPAYSTSFDVGETDDYVFLPSYQDMNNYMYGFSTDHLFYDMNRRAHSSDYAGLQGVLVCTEYKDKDDKYTSPYRLRSAGNESGAVAGVEDYGLNSYSNYTTDFVGFGIRPALCLNPSSTIGGNDDTHAEKNLTFADSDTDGIIDEAGGNVYIYPNNINGITVGEFKSLFKNEIKVNFGDGQKVFNGMTFTFGNRDYSIIIKGDTQADGKINVTDARIILRIAARLETPDEITKYAADIDFDGKVTSAEARSVLRFAAKLQNKIYE